MILFWTTPRWTRLFSSFIEFVFNLDFMSLFLLGALLVSSASTNKMGLYFLNNRYNYYCITISVDYFTSEYLARYWQCNICVTITLLSQSSTIRNPEIRLFLYTTRFIVWSLRVSYNSTWSEHYSEVGCTPGYIIDLLNVILQSLGNLLKVY